ncbi:hypothetical protein [Actinomadura sp. NPDC000600]|uniref:hypothetical protein n=1 Tax=Actinomadura sp. NPDC000600 TaxID=3154262 RepID=UPI003397A03B
MPPRTNDFQAIVFFLMHHRAANARVTESASLPDSRTGQSREVDVLIEAEVACRTVRIGIECRDRKRKADVTWVEAMWAKHQDLPTHQVVLVSSSGFYKNAEKKARQLNMEVVVPGTAVPEDGPLAALLCHRVETREINFGPLVKVEGWVERGGTVQQMQLGINWIVLRADGSRIGTVGDIVRSIAEAAQQEGMREPAATAQGKEKYLAYDREGFLDAYLREETDLPTLLPLHRIRFLREVKVCIRPIQLTTGELEGAGYAAGNGSVVGNNVFVVLSEGLPGGQMSVRFTDSDGNVSDWLADRESQELKSMTTETKEDVTT